MLLLDCREAALGFALQFGTAQHEPTHGVPVGLGLFAGQAAHRHGFVLGIQALVRAQAGPEVGHAGQGLVVSSTQGGCVSHAVQVVDRSPCTPQTLGGHVQHRGHLFPVCRKVGSRHGFQCGIGLRQQCVDGWANLLGQYLVEQRQILKIQQGEGG